MKDLSEIYSICFISRRLKIKILMYDNVSLRLLDNITTHQLNGNVKPKHDALYPFCECSNNKKQNKKIHLNMKKKSLEL